MKDTRFGIEIELTGITREKAAQTAAAFLGGTVRQSGNRYTVTAPGGRVWKVVSDGSIAPQRKERGQRLSADNDYKVELVSPILTYDADIQTVQELVRRLRKAGGFTNSSTGIHIHLDGAPHTPRSIRNFVNIIASKNDLFYKALQIEPGRMSYCKKMDTYLVKRMNQQKPKTLQHIAHIWYEGYNGSQYSHYHASRYHFLNLHSFFHGNRTVELRGFNAGKDGKLHAGNGSNMNLPQMAMRCPTAKVVGTARLHGYRLLFRGQDGGAVATVERFKGGQVPVVLWSITPADEAALDRYEGWPRLYRKEKVKVKMDGEMVRAMVYIMNEGRAIGMPSRSYFGAIKAGYASAGLDTKPLYKALIAALEKGL